MDRAEIYEVVCTVIDEVNDLLSEGSKLEKAPETILVGDGGALDSLGVVNLVLSLERNLDQAVGRPISLTEEHRILERQGALATVGSVVDFIENVVNQG